MIKAFRHAGIVVKNLDNALHFWCEIFDFRIMRQMEENGAFIDKLLGLQNVVLTTVKLAAHDGNQIELLHFHSHEGGALWQGSPTTFGLTHLAFTVENLDGMCAILAKKGYRPISPPLLSEDGKVRVVYLRAFENLLLELVEEM